MAARFFNHAAVRGGGRQGNSAVALIGDDSEQPLGFLLGERGEGGTVAVGAWHTKLGKGQNIRRTALTQAEAAMQRLVRQQWAGEGAAGVGMAEHVIRYKS